MYYTPKYVNHVSNTDTPKNKRIFEQYVLLYMYEIPASSAPAESLTMSQGPLSSNVQAETYSGPKCTVEVPESGGDIWDYDRHRWSKKRSALCTYEW